MTQCDRLGQRHVEAEGGGHGHSNLGHFEGMGQAGALMIVREDEHLGLSSQAAEGGGMENAVPVALEAGALGVGPLLSSPVAGTLGSGGARGHPGVLGLFAGIPVGWSRCLRRTRGLADAQGAARVSRAHARLVGMPGGQLMTAHRCGPGSGSFAVGDRGLTFRWGRSAHGADPRELQ